MTKQSLSVYISKDILNRYKSYCEMNGMSVSKRIEILMKKELEGVNK